MKKLGEIRGKKWLHSALFFLYHSPKNCFFSFFLDISTGESVGTGRAYHHTYGLTFYKNSPLLLHQKYFFQNFLFRPKKCMLPPARATQRQDLLKLLQKNIRYKIPVFFIEKCEEIYTHGLLCNHGSAQPTLLSEFFFIRRHNFFLLSTFS